MSEKVKNILIACLSVMLVFWLGLSFYFRLQSVASNNEVNETAKQAHNEYQKYQKKKKVVEKKVYVYASDHGNSETKIVGQKYVDRNLLATQGQTFFRIVFDYNNGQGYIDRRQKASGLADDNVLNNKDLFGESTQSAKKAIDMLGTTSKFVESEAYYTNTNGYVVNGLIKVTYQMGSKQGSRFYHVSYDKNLGKFTDVSVVNK